MTNKLYLTPYSFRDRSLSFAQQVEKAKQLGFDGIEGGLGVGSLTDEECAILDANGMELCIGMLLRDADGKADPQQIERFRARGITLVTVQAANFRFTPPVKDDFRGMPGMFGTREQAIEAAHRAEETAAFVGQYGLKNYYHNHTHEFRVDGGQTLLETYLDHTPENHVLEFDLGWCLTAGDDPIRIMKKYPGRIGALHIKSCNWVIGPEALGMLCPVPPLTVGITDDHKNANQTYAEAVQGPMSNAVCNWRDILLAAADAGCDTFIIERERDYCGDRLRCLQEDHDFIRSCMG